ncbi:MAG: hypothetical protein ACRDIB_17390, partial [Ardenticatenaceae bacterium]
GPLSFALRLSSFVLLLWLAFSSIQNLPWETREVDVARHPAQMWEEDAAVGQVGATWTAEFLPRVVEEQRWALARAPEAIPDVGARTPLQVQRAGGDGFSFWAEVEATESGAFTFPRFTYPSMQATIDGEEVPIKARSEMGLVTVRVPGGVHRVALEAVPLADRSWLSWLLWLPPLAAIVYLLSRLDRQWLVAGMIGVPLLVLTAYVRILGPGRTPASEIIAPEPYLIGQQAQLVGLRIEPAKVQPGRILPVTLLWFNLERTGQRYVTFIHLTMPGGGEPIAQQDGEPNMGTVPTPRWLPGQLVEDLHLLPLPDDLPPGEYALWGGMYQVENGTAIPLPGDSGARRLLGRITIR